MIRQRKTEVRSNKPHQLIMPKNKRKLQVYLNTYIQILNYAYVYRSK